MAGARPGETIAAGDQIRRASRQHRYIFGHGKDGFGVTGSRAELARFRDYLTAVLDYTSRQIAAGKAREEIARTTTLPGFEEYAAPDSPDVSLATVLTIAYDEVKDQ